MEALDEVEALRSRANAHLEALLLHAAEKSPQEIAALITELAYDHGPLRDFFAIANGASREPPQSPRNTLKSRSSRSILRFSRSSKLGPPESKASVSSQPITPIVNNTGAQSTGRMSTKAVPMSSCFSTAPRPIKGSASIQYQCIICDEFLSSKGVCKRHLEDQHVSPKQYKCEKCALVFSVKAKCKEHIKDCGKGVFLYVVVKPEEKRVYACDFTGDVFSSMARYVEHLLHLSERVEDRPGGDLHRKLYALLDRPHLEPYVAEFSQRMYASDSAWRNLYWDLTHLIKAIETLENADVYENGTLEVAKHIANGQRIYSTETFVGSLLSEGKVRPSSRHTVRSSRKDAMSRSSSTSFGSSKTLTPKASLNPVSADDPPVSVSVLEHSTAPAMPAIPSAVVASGAVNAMAQATMDQKGKRHLSDNSRFYVPDRLPPGPPLPPLPPSLPQHLQQIYNLDSQTSGHTTPLNVSTASLPLRPPDLPVIDQNTLPLDYQSRQVYTPSIETTGSSDAASVSTLMSNYQEPELVTPMSFDYNMWTSHNTMHFPIPPNHNMNYHIPHPDFFYTQPSSTSTRTPSIATEQTYVMDFNAMDRKSVDTGSVHSIPQSGTFLWDDEESNEVTGMH